MPVDIALSGTSLLLSLATAITGKSFKIFIVKQEKHDAIKLFAQTTLDSIANIISQAMQDRDISPTEFHKVQQEVEKYCKLKKLILGTRPGLRQNRLQKNSEKKILEQGRKEGKEDFLRKITSTSGTQGVNAI